MSIIYYQKELEKEPLFRYMPLERFLQMLESKKFYVSCRGKFKDKLETKLEIRRNLAIQAVGENVPNQDEIMRKQAENLKHKSEEHSGFASIPTSCWTYQRQENIFMWDCYANKLGVRIESSIENMIPAFENVNSDVLFTKMLYEFDSPFKSATDLLMTKHPAYSDEREIRAYFCHIIEKDGEYYIKMAEDEKKENHILIDIEPKKMISHVVLSPYFASSVSRKFASWIESNYGIKASASSIVL